MPPEDKNPKTPSTKRPSRKRTTEPPKVEQATDVQPVAHARAKTPRATPKPKPEPKPKAERKPRAPRKKAATMRDVGVPQRAEGPDPSSVEGLSILMVTSEAHPFAKTGGLAEVSAALTDALARLGHSVTLVLPRYRRIDVGDAQRLDAVLTFGSRRQPVTFYERALAERVNVVFVDVAELFDRDELYGTATGDYPDNPWRFAVFSRAALEYPRVKQWRPSIIHAHDWQAALVPVYQKMQSRSIRSSAAYPASSRFTTSRSRECFPPRRSTRSASVTTSCTCRRWSTGATSAT